MTLQQGLSITFFLALDVASFLSPVSISAISTAISTASTVSSTSVGQDGVSLSVANTARAVVCVMAVAGVVLRDVVVVGVLDVVSQVVHILVGVYWVHPVDGIMGWVVNVVVHWHIVGVMYVSQRVVGVGGVMDSGGWAAVGSAVIVVHNWDTSTASSAASNSSSISSNTITGS